MLKRDFIRKCNPLIRPNYWLKLKKSKSDEMPSDEEDFFFLNYMGLMHILHETITDILQSDNLWD